MEFSRQEYYSGLDSLLQEILPTQGSNLCPLHWQADSQPLDHQASPVFQYLDLAYEFRVQKGL